MSVEIEKTTNGQVRIKYSTDTSSTFLVNSTNVSIYPDSFNTLYGSKKFHVKGSGFNYTFKLSDITTINGLPAPSTVEEAMEIIADEVFAG